MRLVEIPWSSDATPRLGSSMFETYLIAQKKQQQIDHETQVRNKAGKFLSMHHSRDQNRESDASSSSLAQVSQVLLSDDDDDDDDEIKESDVLDNKSAFEAAVIAARTIQSRGRRTPVQDALIHRSLLLLFLKSCSLSYKSWDTGLQCRKLANRCKRRMMELKSFWNWKFRS
jgi:hypothetical protein